jgi:Xaa-Pro aminopeptidase
MLIVMTLVALNFPPFVRPSYYAGMTEVTVKLPDELADKIKAAGLLQEEALEAVFREALPRTAVDELFGALDKIEAAKLPPMTEAEIQAEIDAARAERRARSRS